LVARVVTDTPGGVSLHLKSAFIGLVCLAALGWLGSWGWAQEGLEGRIVAIDDATAVALVQLPSGAVIEAQLPVASAFYSEDMPAFEVGQRVELAASRNPVGTVAYDVIDWVRRPALLWLSGLFFAVILLVAQWKGLRAFIATSFALVVVVLFIIPQIMAGWPPVLVAVLGVGSMSVLAIYLVHGVNWSTTAALLGTVLSLVITYALGAVVMRWARLTGFGIDGALFLAQGAPQVDLRALLQAGLVIGALGALTDTTIIQASVVRELSHVNPFLGIRELYRRGMNVGKDHVGSLVNTLVFAYSGAALPLFILFTLNDVGVMRALNSEFIATEVIFMVVGSIGLVISVPLTTFMAAFIFRGDHLPMVASEHHHAGFAPREEQLAFQRERQFELLETIDPEVAKRELLKRLEQDDSVAR
jgi:uncharacterized membrane protein